MGRHNQPHRTRYKKSPACFFFFGGSSFIFATFVFVVPAMPRLNPATLAFPSLHAILVLEETSSSSLRHANLGTTLNLHGGVQAERSIGAEPSKESWVVRKGVDVVGQHESADAKIFLTDVFFEQESESSSLDVATHEQMDAPFGSRIEHSSELQSSIIDPRRIQVISLDNPRAFLFRRFLSDAECDFLVVGESVGTSGLKLCAVVFLIRRALDHLSVLCLLVGVLRHFLLLPFPTCFQR